MKKKLSKKIIISLLISLAGLSFAAFAVYAAGVVFFGGGSAQTIVTFQTVGTRTWTVPEGVTTVEVLTVAGGGGGGMDMGGGGGGGGVIYNSDYSVTPGSNITVTIGAGGNGAPAANTGGQPGGHQYTISATNGQNSVFGSITALGGGYGGSSYFQYTPNYGLGNSGGSGGGSSGYTAGNTTIGAAGTAGQGFKGGNAGGASYASGGGGGAGGPGANGPNQANGGPGILYSSMSSYYFGGGGGGAAYSLANGGNGGIGGGGGGAIGVTYGGAGLNNGAPGGGGIPNDWGNRPGGNAGANTGGGGGGGSHYNANNKGGNGGSGIVIIRYGKSKMAASSIGKGIVGHWALDGDGYNASTGRVTDKTPYEHHGTNNGATLTTDQKGQTNGAMSFDGNDYVTVGTSGSVGPINEMSVFAWIKVPSGIADGTRIGNIIGNFSNSPNFNIEGYTTGSLRVYWNNGERDFSSTGFDMRDNTWHLVGFVRNSGTNSIQMYIDGVPNSSTSAGTSVSYQYPLKIGDDFRNGSTPGIPFNGSISDVRVYNRALSATEVTTLYGAYKPKVTAGSLQKGLVLDMPLTSSYTKTVTAGSQIMTDRTPYSHDGQNHGATVGSDSTSFNGSSYIGVPDSTVFNNQTLSISAWVQLTALAQNGFIFEKGTVNTQYSLFFEGSNLAFRTKPTTGSYDSDYLNTASLGITDTNTWYYLTATYDGSYKRVYVNGILKSEVAWSATLNTNPGGEWVGVHGGGGYLFNGKISALRIYNRALSPQEIESLYVQGATNLGGVKSRRASCKAILDAGESTGDGFYTIKPNSGGLSFQAYCDMTTDGGGWTLVLLNNKGLTSPTPTWDSAINDVNTTGSLNSNLTSFDLFLGVSYWKNLGSKMRLQIGSSPSSLTNKSIYSGFSFGGNYALTMSGETIVVGSGSPGMYNYHAANHFNLSTSDRDNDIHSSNCSAVYGGSPWWYGECWSGSFWGYDTSQGPRWDGSGGTESQWGSIWIGQ